jgi:Flp pilus assembly protein TadD
VHYRMFIPDGTGSKLTLEARLCYRKFSWWNTQFAFGGVPDPTQLASPVAPGYDDTKYLFTGSLKGISAKEEKIPDVPIVALAGNQVTLNVAPRNAPVLPPKTDLRAEDWQRWNDYGIGLLLQGDLKGAEAAFQKVTTIDPTNPDGWVNIGRAAVQEGDMDRARTVLEKAISLRPNLARAHYFYSRVLRSDGNYEGTASELRKVLEQYPRDRVVLNDLGRVLFLERKYADAVKVLNAVLAIDPEDLEAHYNLMLSYNGLGEEKQAHDHQVRYLRFKADEAAQTITGPYRQLHPEDNNERQAIHEHLSVPLPILKGTSAPTTEEYERRPTRHAKMNLADHSRQLPAGRSVPPKPGSAYAQASNPISSGSQK